VVDYLAQTREKEEEEEHIKKTMNITIFCFILLDFAIFVLIICLFKLW